LNTFYTNISFSAIETRNEEERWIVVAIEKRELNYRWLLAIARSDDPARVGIDVRIPEPSREEGLDGSG